MATCQGRKRGVADLPGTVCQGPSDGWSATPPNPCDATATSHRPTNLRPFWQLFSRHGFAEPWPLKRWETTAMPCWIWRRRLWHFHIFHALSVWSYGLMAWFVGAPPRTWRQNHHQEEKWDEGLGQPSGGEHVLCAAQGSGRSLCGKALLISKNFTWDINDIMKSDVRNISPWF